MVHVDIANDGNGLIRRFNYEKNSLWINQLLGESKISERSNLIGVISYTLLMEACQTEFKMFLEMKLLVINYRVSAQQSQIFSKIKEDELAANASFDYKFKRMKMEIFLEKLLLV
jgi:hypothetical protein